MGRKAAFAALAIALTACDREPIVSSPLEDTTGPVLVGLDLSRRVGAPGDTLVAAIRVDSGTELGALRATLRWDPSDLEWLGQIPDASAPTGVSAVDGALDVAVANATGLTSRPLVVAYRLRRPGGLGTLRLAEMQVWSPSAEPRLVAVAGADYVTDLPDPAQARPLDFDDWAALLGAPSARPSAALVPGASAVYGDATQDGAINVLDVAYTANLAVGNLILGECIVGTDAPARDCVAANVAPFNLPGLGEQGDACPPGLEVCGTTRRVLNVLDALFISREAVGQDQPVVGESIPRAAPTGAAALEGTLTGTRTLSADTVYTLGRLIVGDTLGTVGTLAIPAGTRVVGQEGGELVVRRGSTLNVDGTAADPVVFDCGTQPRGCWKGIRILGAAPINFGTPTSPDGGCNEAVGPEQFGGCDPDDSSGRLHYLRVHFALTGLSLEGVGRGTSIDHVQVDRSVGTGANVVGGTVDLRHVFLSGNRINGLDWSGGWTGRAQSVVVAQDPLEFRAGIRGTAAPGSGSSVGPTLSHVTVVAATDSTNPNGEATALRLEGGVSADLSNVVLFDGQVGLDLDDEDTCTSIAAGTLTLNAVIVVGAGVPGSLDADPSGCSTLGLSSPTAERSWLESPSVAGYVRVTDPAEVSGFLRSSGLALSDFRPARGSAADTLPTSPIPNDGFFDTSLSFIGGVEPLNFASSNVPWYAGWILPFSVSLPAAPVVSMGSIEVGDEHGCGVDRSGQVMCWGDNFFGQLGDSTRADRPLASPTRLTGSSLYDLTQLSAGKNHSCGVTSTGQAVCWGRNDNGAGGIGATTPGFLTAPAPVTGGLTATAAYAGGAHGCLITGAGDAYCWGDGSAGQLGTGATTSHTSPVPVTGGLKFAHLALGASHTCGTTTDATPVTYCWGDNFSGQLGDGTFTTPRLVPTAVASSVQFASLTAGDSHTCGLDASGSAYCWGSNGFGQLGVSSPSISTSPVAVGGGLTFSQLSAGFAHTCAIDSTSDAYCWGLNSSGQLGTGSLSTTSSPSPVSTELSWAAVDAGELQTCAIDLDRRAFCWGKNDTGQLGNGVLTDSTVPVEVRSGGVIFGETAFRPWSIGGNGR